MIKRISVATKSRTDFIDITSKIREALGESGKTSGICTVYVPHTTAGVTINENADPDVKTDIINALENLVPWTRKYLHMEGNSPAHVKATITGFSTSIPFDSGRLLFGTW